ncbi:hypothetical protein PC116_g29945 [Phytophthora cactorum]|nr:hypothetical protein PC116_g29945 [Phytophthora cactorum]
MSPMKAIPILLGSPEKGLFRSTMKLMRKEADIDFSDFSTKYSTGASEENGLIPCFYTTAFGKH